MIVLDRLKMELSNQQYFTDEQYVQYLFENNLKSTDDYVKSTMQKNLYLSVIDILGAVANDVDLMHSISTEYSNIGAAYEFIENRISQIKDKIAAIPDENEDYNCFSLMYSRNDVRNYTPKNYGNNAISNTEIDSIV